MKEIITAEQTLRTQFVQVCSTNLQIFTLKNMENVALFSFESYNNAHITPSTFIEIKFIFEASFVSLSGTNLLSPLQSSASNFVDLYMADL